MKTQPVKQRVELSRHLALPVIFLAMLAIPWFLGGRDPFGGFVSLLIVALLFASWLLLSRFQALAVSWRPRFVMYSLAGIVGWSFVSVMWSVSRFESIIFLTTVFAAGLVFVIARDIFRDISAREFFARIFVFSALAVAAFGIGLYVLGDYERATSLFYWPNPLATYLIAALSFGLMLARRTGHRRPSGWLMVNSILLTGLVLTFSRAGWLILALLALIMLWRSRDRRLFLIQTGMTLAIAIVLSLTASSARELLNKPSINVASRVTESAQSTSVTDRFTYWREGSAMFAERPVLGWGVGSYKQVHPAYQRSATTATNNPHNSLVQVFVELGAIGAVLYILTIFGFLRVLWLDRRDPSDDVIWAARLAVIGIGLHSLLDLVTNYPTLILILAICLALALPLTQAAREFRLRAWPVIITFFIISLLLVGFLRTAQFIYLSKVDRAYIDIVGAVDRQEVDERYQELLERPVAEPEALSAAALNIVDLYDTAKNPDKAKLERALGYAERAVELESQNARHWYALANVQQRLGKTTEALKSYQRAVELDPYNNPQYQVSYALLLQQQGYTREAISILRPIANEYTDAVIANRSFASDIKTRLAIVYTLLARLESEAGNANQARSDLGRALQLNSRYVPAQDLRQKLFPNQ